MDNGKQQGTSGLVEAAEKNTTSSPDGYDARNGCPSSMSPKGKYDPDAAQTAMPGNKNVLDAGFGAVDDEHGSEMFKGLKTSGRGQ